MTSTKCHYINKTPLLTVCRSAAPKQAARDAYGSENVPRSVLDETRSRVASSARQCLRRFRGYRNCHARATSSGRSSPISILMNGLTPSRPFTFNQSGPPSGSVSIRNPKNGQHSRSFAPKAATNRRQCRSRRFEGARSNQKLLQPKTRAATLRRILLTRRIKMRLPVDIGGRTNKPKQNGLRAAMVNLFRHESIQCGRLANDWTRWFLPPSRQPVRQCWKAEALRPPAPAGCVADSAASYLVAGRMY